MRRGRSYLKRISGSYEAWEVVFKTYFRFVFETSSYLKRIYGSYLKRISGSYSKRM